MLKNRNKFILLSCGISSLIISAPSYPFSKDCDLFSKEIYVPSQAGDFYEINNKLINSADELQELVKNEKLEFDNGKFAYAELVNSLGYVEQKYYAYTFDIKENIVNSNNKVFLKVPKDSNTTDTILKAVGKSQTPNNKNYKLKIYRISLDGNALQYNKVNIDKIEQKLHSVRIYNLPQGDINLIKKLTGVVETRNLVLSAEQKHIEYVILTNEEETSDPFREGFPNKKDQDKYKILSLDDALKVLHNYENIYFILPKFHALHNEWLYSQKQKDFQIAERLDANGKSFSPKEFYISSGEIAKTNYAHSHKERLVEEFETAGSILFSNSVPSKRVNYTLTFINAKYYHSYDEISSENALRSTEFNKFKEVIAKIHSEKKIKQKKNDIAYAEFTDNNKLVRKYFAIDKTDFDKSSNKSDIDFIMLEGKIKKLPEVDLLAIDTEFKLSNSDAEQRILEKFLMDTKYKRLETKGKLKIYTTLGICEPCRAFYSFFKKLRPNVDINIVSLAEKDKEILYKELAD